MTEPRDHGPPELWRAHTRWRQAAKACKRLLDPGRTYKECEAIIASDEYQQAYAEYQAARKAWVELDRADIRRRKGSP